MTLFAPGAWAAEPVLKPVLLDDEMYTESFVAMADLEDGTYVKVQLGISNAGPGDANGACRIFVSRPSGNFDKSSVVDNDEWRFDAEKASLSIAACKMTAGKNFTFEGEVEGAKLLFTLEATPERTPVHAAKSGDNFYELEALIPWAPAKVTVTFPKEAPRTISGFGYADHSRANALPGKTAKSWVRFRAFSKEGARLVLIRFPPSGKPYTGWVWDPPAKTPKEVTRASLQPGKSDDKSKAFRVMIDGDGGPWRISSQKLIERDAPIEERGALGMVLGAVVGNPVTYTYRAVLEGKQDRSELRGILEVTLVDE
jgi:hypothetical protein